MSSMPAVKLELPDFWTLEREDPSRDARLFLRATAIDVSLRYDFRGDAGSASKGIGKLSRWSL